MSNELEKIPAPKSKEFELESIENINYKPHPYCITEKHILEDRIYLDKNTIKEAEEKGVTCGMYVSPDGKHYANEYKSGWQRCIVPYEEHTSDKVLFLKVLVNKEIKDLIGLQIYLKRIVSVMKKLKIDGIAFIKD